MTFNFGGGSTAPATGLNMNAAPAMGLNMNAAATNTSQSTGFSFGTATKQPAGVTFGAPSSAPTAAVAPLPAATKTPAVSFGAPASSATGLTLNFGTPATSATSAPPAFGAAATSTAAPSFGGFGGPAPASSATFGAPAISAAAFGAPAFGTAASTAATGFGSGFGFGTTTTISQAPAQGLNLAAATTTTGTPAFGSVGLGGLGGTTTTAAGLGGALAVAGLGGTGAQQGQAQTHQEGKIEGKAVKESMIPTELGSTVEELKKIMKEEKSVSSDISHVSAKPYNKIKDETEALSQLVNVLAIGVQKNRTALDRLKADTAQELVNVETAQRTKETPPAMQYENVAPLDFFNRLVGQFEFEMTNYRKQIEQTELHLQAMGNSDGIRSQDLTLALQKLHEAFTDLAAKYGGIHHQVAKQKEHYLNIHRHLHGTNTSIFERKSSVGVRSSPALPSLVGPSPFTGPQDPLAQARAHLLNHSQQPTPSQTGPPTLALSSMGTNPAFKQPTAAGFGSGTAGFGSGTAGFGANTTGFGGNTTAFGASTSGFGAANTSGFGGSGTAGFGTSTPGFGGGFVSPTPAFGSTNSSVFGSPTTGNKRGKH